MDNEERQALRNGILGSLRIQMEVTRKIPYGDPRLKIQLLSGEDVLSEDWVSLSDLQASDLRLE